MFLASKIGGSEVPLTGDHVPSILVLPSNLISELHDEQTRCKRRQAYLGYFLN